MNVIPFLHLISLILQKNMLVLYLICNFAHNLGKISSYFLIGLPSGLNIVEILFTTESLIEKYIKLVIQ